MEAIKNAIGLGGSQVQSGQEPVSGETGSGTVSDPYDAGNAIGQSGLATDETTKETTERNSYSTSDPGNKKNTIADQLSSTSTGNTSAAAGDSNVSRGNGPDSTHSPKALGQSESVNSVGSIFRQMSDTAAAKLLNEQNLIFSDDSLSPQERIYQLYMLLLRYDKSGDTEKPEIPNPSEDATNMVDGAIGPFDGPVTKHSPNPTEEKQGLHHSLAKPVETQDNPIEEEKVKTEDTNAGENVPATVLGISGSVVHDNSEVLHDGQNKEEEINVPVVGVETGGADTSAANISGTGGIGADKNGGLGEAYSQSPGLIAGGGESNAAKADNTPEPDYLREERSVHLDSGIEAASCDNERPELSEPTKKSKREMIKEKLHLGKK